MKNNTLVTIASFAIATAANNQLAIALTVELATGETLEIVLTSESAIDLHNRLLGLLKVAGVSSSDELVDSEILVEVENGEIVALKHLLEARHLVLGTLKLAKAA